MTDIDNLTLQMLKKIDQKLATVLDKLSSAENRSSSSANVNSLSARAKEIAALTPRRARQTNATELLHEDRQR